MAWVKLIIAGLLEIVWAIAMKYAEGFTKLWPSVITIVGMIISFFLLSMATKELPIGTAYAVWTGIGALGTVLFGILLFHEPINIMKSIFLCMIIFGIVGLKLTSA